MENPVHHHEIANQQKGIQEWDQTRKGGKVDKCNHRLRFDSEHIYGHSNRHSIDLTKKNQDILEVWRKEIKGCELKSSPSHTEVNRRVLKVLN